MSYARLYILLKTLCPMYRLTFQHGEKILCALGCEETPSCWKDNPIVWSPTSRYFKPMIWGLVTLVVALIAIYQVGVLLGHPYYEWTMNLLYTFTCCHTIDPSPLH